MNLSQILIMHAVDAMLTTCGNSYANAYTEQWLRYAHSLGAYHGAFVGKIKDLETAWEAWLEANGGLPDWPYKDYPDATSPFPRGPRKNPDSAAP